MTDRTRRLRTIPTPMPERPSGSREVQIPRGDGGELQVSQRKLSEQGAELSTYRQLVDGFDFADQEVRAPEPEERHPAIQTVQELAANQWQSNPRPSIDPAAVQRGIELIAQRATPVEAVVAQAERLVADQIPEWGSLKGRCDRTRVSRSTMAL